MQSAIVTAPGRIELAERPIPKPGTGEVLVRVACSGVNRADVWQMHGGYAAPPDCPQDVPGIEFAGFISDVGPGVSRFRPGDRVFGLCGGGAHAEFLVAKEVLCLPLMKSVSDEKGGALAQSGVTADEALFDLGELGYGQNVLIFSSTSGVGLMAARMANRAGCSVTGTTRSDEKGIRFRRDGLGESVVLRSGMEAQAIVSRISAVATGFNLILDLVGGEYTRAAIELAGKRSTVVCLSTLGGDDAVINLRTFLNKRVKLVGSVLRHRPLRDKEAAVAAFQKRHGSAINRGELSIEIADTYHLESVAEAYQRVASNATYGRVVLVM